MGCHRNHTISHSPNQNFFEDTFISHPGGPIEQFGTHEKLSWGVQGNLNWMPGYYLYVSDQSVYIGFELSIDLLNLTALIKFILDHAVLVTLWMCSGQLHVLDKVSPKCL